MAFFPQFSQPNEAVLRPIEAVVFDLDGVIIDAKKFHRDCFIEACKQGAGLIIDEEFHEKHLEALSSKQKIEKLSQMRLINSDKDKVEVSFRKQQLTLGKIGEVALTVPWMKSIMTHIKERDLYIALCSNSVRETCINALSAHGLLPYFDLIVSNEDVRNNKPSPEPYVEVAARLNTIPARLLVFEDSDVGIASALNAGCIVTPVFDPHYDLELSRVTRWIRCIAG